MLLRRVLARPLVRAAQVGGLALVLAAASPAGALVLAGDLVSGSRLTQGGSSTPLTGPVTLDVGALPPLAANVTLDVVSLDAETPSLDPSIEPVSITLDGGLANPGLGVWFPDGTFLIPSLHLSVDGVDLTVTDVAGTFGASTACGGALCLETSFDVDPGSGGLVTVDVVAAFVPEPGASVLAAFVVLGAACRRARSRA